ncbi:hypothetical protein Tco_0707541 [Tanacetum coccineum]|uniref:Uncharacterized protein n=1 Tax=Tanacetum coccineum TaxID=301880 RepID=A0ABQ4YAH4_9ASTR
MTLDHGVDEAVQKEGGGSVERAITTDASLVAAHDSGSPRRQEPGGALAQTRSERVLEKPNELPLPECRQKIDTHLEWKGSMEHTFEFGWDTVPTYTHDSPLSEVLDLEKEKDAQAVEILKLKQKIKANICVIAWLMYFRLDLDDGGCLKTGGISNKQSQCSNIVTLMYMMIPEDVEGEIVHTTTTRVSAVSAPVTTTGVAISTAEPRTPPTTAAPAFIDEDLTIAQTLIKIKEDIAKEKGVAIKDVEDSPRPIRSITNTQPLTNY